MNEYIYNLSTSLERPFKELLNVPISFEICHSELKSKKGIKMAKKSLFTMGYSLWYIKIDPSTEYS